MLAMPEASVSGTYQSVTPKYNKISKKRPTFPPIFVYRQYVPPGNYEGGGRQYLKNVRNYKN